MKILVTGGSGFIGTAISKHAAEEGVSVVNISRRGKSKCDEDWVEKVDWIKSDIFDPKCWQNKAKGCDTIVHCIGIITEAPEKGITYEKLNGDSPIIVAEAAKNLGAHSFIFLSASVAPPGISDRFIKEKRRAEEQIKKFGMRTVIFRPGPVWGPTQPMSPFIRSLLTIGASIPILRKIVGPAKPLHIETLVKSVMKAIVDQTITGIVDIQKIIDLSQSV